MITVYLTSYELQPDKKKQKLEHEIGILLLQKGLKEQFQLSLEVDKLKEGMKTGEHGKPYLCDYENIHFNISHSGSLAACAVSDKPVGIDVQIMRLVRKALARKVCTRRELSYLKDAEGFGELLTGRALVRFYRVWCSKEAYFKWLGTGITDLKSFDTVDHIFSGGTFQIDEYMVSIYE